MAPQSTDVEPMQTALINYAASFAHFKGTAEAYHAAATTRIEICSRFTEQLLMQKRASVLARSSLQIYHGVVETSLKALDVELERASAEVDRVLPTFEQTVTCLRETELHPAHCSMSRLPEGTRLISFVKDEEALRRRVADCRQIRTTLEEQVRASLTTLEEHVRASLTTHTPYMHALQSQHLRQATPCTPSALHLHRGLGLSPESQPRQEVKEGRRQFEEMSIRVTEELQRSAGEEGLVKAADEALTAIRDAVKNTVEGKLSKFAGDFQELEGYLSKGNVGQAPVSWEYMGQLQRKYQAGKDSVMVLSDVDKDLADRLAQCANRKENMTRVVVSRLQKVADLQGQLQQLKKKWDAVQEVARQELRRQFGEVDVIVNLPNTYREWCHEVAKRRSYWTSTVSQVRVGRPSMPVLRRGYFPLALMAPVPTLGCVVS